MQRAFLCLICLLISLAALAQQRTIRGRVLDKETGKPMRVVSVQLKQTARGALTDTAGRFTITAPPGSITLVLNQIGYVRKTVVVGPNVDDALTVRMEADTKALNEVVVTGYGTMPKRRLTPIDASVAAERSSMSSRSSFSRSEKAMPGTSSSSRTVAFAPTETQQQAGQLTAGEIYDYSKWTLWQDITKNDLKQYRTQWRQAPTERYSVQLLTTDGFPVIDAPIRLLNSQQQVYWQARTDNTGRAELWRSANWATAADSIAPATGKLLVEATVAGKAYTLRNPRLFGHGSNTITVSQPCQGASAPVDVAFVVDATGSMGDEIAYLKAELTDVISRARQAAPGSTIRLGSVFYRDYDDDYLTRTHDFSDQPDSTVAFIKDQKADGGGDFPEAVDTALAVALTQLSWSKVAKTRLLFLVLDAPPHDDEAAKLSLQRSVAKAAAMGIRLIPVAASGIDKSTEYLLRAMALATNGTYVFLTDDSGIGNSHIKPTTDQYTVEKLNALLVRLITKFTQTPDCHPVANATPAERYTEQGTPADTTVKTATAPSEARFRFFPNPTRDYLTIENPEAIRDLYVLDITGKVLLRETPAQATVRLDMQPYPTGTYLFRFAAADTWQTGRFLVTK